MSDQMPLDYRPPTEPEPRRRMTPAGRERLFFRIAMFIGALFLIVVAIIAIQAISGEVSRVREHKREARRAWKARAPYVWICTASGPETFGVRRELDARADNVDLHNLLY